MDRIKKVKQFAKEKGCFVGNKIKDFFVENGEEIATGLILGMASYGAFELGWSLGGGRKFEHEVSKAIGYDQGFKEGQQNAAELIGTANGVHTETVVKQ